jgi:NAD(P)H-dependent FMN reductase
VSSFPHVVAVSGSLRAGSSSSALLRAAADLSRHHLDVAALAVV